MGVETAPLPYPGYEAHVVGMTEEQNDARNARNELAWTNHQINNQIMTVDSLRDRLIEAEATLGRLLSEQEWLTRNQEDEEA